MAEENGTSGAVSAAGSSKENDKQEHATGNGLLQLPPLRSEASGNGVDVEMKSVSPALVGVHVSMAA